MEGGAGGASSMLGTETGSSRLGGASVGSTMGARLGSAEGAGVFLGRGLRFLWWSWNSSRGGGGEKSMGGLALSEIRSM
ncbi:hypothetical protein D3C86_2141620 [compost metagenome]